MHILLAGEFLKSDINSVYPVCKFSMAN